MTDDIEFAWPFDLTRINHPTDALREDHRFLERDGKQLFCAEYIPSGESSVGVVLCSPFAEERVRSLRVYVSLARTLARLGMTTVTFDYYGDGDSEGLFEDASFDDRLNDIRAVTAELKERHKLDRLVLLGLRWGGTLAALLAEELSPEALILWEPVVDTEKYFFDHLRSNLATQMLTEGRIVQKREDLLKSLDAGEMLTVEGYNLTREFYHAARAATLKDKQFDLSAPTQIVQLAGNPERIRPELDELSQSFNKAELFSLRREFEWEKTEQWNPAPPNLFRVTCHFLKSHGLY